MQVAFLQSSTKSTHMWQTGQIFLLKLELQYVTRDRIKILTLKLIPVSSSQDQDSDLEIKIKVSDQWLETYDLHEVFASASRAVYVYIRVVMTFAVQVGGDSRVLEAYNNCISALVHFRSRHLQLVAK